MSILIHPRGVALAVLLLSPALSLAQSASEEQSRVWPAPVRIASTVVPFSVEETAEYQTDEYQGAAGYPSPLPLNTLRTQSQPHHVIRAPGRQLATANRHAKKVPHPPHHGLHRRIQPQPAIIPDASQRETWKSPYSYGYFGASGKRHWTLHYGYRDRYTEWRLK